MEDGTSTVTVLSHEEDAMSLFSPSKQGKTFFLMVTFAFTPVLIWNLGNENPHLGLARCSVGKDTYYLGCCDSVGLFRMVRFIVFCFVFACYTGFSV